VRKWLTADGSQLIDTRSEIPLYPISPFGKGGIDGGI